MFHFSDYSQHLKIFDLVNKKIIGKMKDEFKGKIISAFVGLKSKIYSSIDVDNEENKKAKGVKINCIKLEPIKFLMFFYLVLMVKCI